MAKVTTRLPNNVWCVTGQLLLLYEYDTANKRVLRQLFNSVMNNSAE